MILKAEIHTPDFDVRFATLDPAKRTYRSSGRFFAELLFNGEGRVALPVGKVCFQNAPPVVADGSDDERLQAVNARVSADLGIVTTVRARSRLTTLLRTSDAPSLPRICSRCLRITHS